MVHKVLYGNWKTTTFIAALRHDHVTAPFVLEGAMNGETFRAYVEQILAPTLKRGDIVFMDNVPIHKVAGVREAIEARGAILIYLPAYSPGFNPIEQVFAKLKTVLRKIAAYWPAPGSEDTELGVLMELEVGHGETEVHAGIQA